MKSYCCPVCGYSKLNEPSRDSQTGGGSYEICPSCGFEFGVSDDDAGWNYESWREKWVNGGMKWYSRGLKKPKNWNPKKQFLNLDKCTEK